MAELADEWSAQGLTNIWGVIPVVRSQAFSDKRVLNLVGLANLIDRLDERGPWDQTLSGGEKQPAGIRANSFASA